MKKKQTKASSRDKTKDLVEILKNGFKAIGYDKAENMVNTAKECLKQNGFDSELAFLDDSWW